MQGGRRGWSGEVFREILLSIVARKRTLFRADRTSRPLLPVPPPRREEGTRSCRGDEELERRDVPGDTALVRCSYFDLIPN